MESSESHVVETRTEPADKEDPDIEQFAAAASNLPRLEYRTNSDSDPNSDSESEEEYGEQPPEVEASIAAAGAVAAAAAANTVSVPCQTSPLRFPEGSTASHTPLDDCESCHAAESTSEHCPTICTPSPSSPTSDLSHRNSSPARRPRNHFLADLGTKSQPGYDASAAGEDGDGTVDIEEQIRAIARDVSLSEVEKNAQRQAILGQKFQQQRRRNALAFCESMQRDYMKESYSDILDPITGEKMLGCEHYPRNCKIKADCCGLWVVCRLCHDHPSMDHAIDRFATKEIMCMKCKTIQPVSNHCVEPSCKTKFAEYFCETCKFFDNTPGKDIYHCDKCKICRIGKGIGHDNFHCDRCDACVSLEYSKNHRCLKKSLDSNCPICGLYLFTSTKPVVFMRCGHTMHAHCFDVYTTDNYICPLCSKVLTNMRPYWEQIEESLKRDKMPPEHHGKVSEILCHDCDERSEAPYHFLYHKCMASRCGSYNTRVLRTYRKEVSACGSSSQVDEEES